MTMSSKSNRLPADYEREICKCMKDLRKMYSDKQVERLYKRIITKQSESSIDISITNTRGRELKKKLLALVSIMEQIKKERTTGQSITPQEALSCRYLRLTKRTIEELEAECRESGTEPGLHAHLTETDLKKLIFDSEINIISGKAGGQAGSGTSGTADPRESVFELRSTTSSVCP